MGCGYDFDRASLYKIMGVSFMNKDFKRIRETILYDREKTFFPATQLLIEQERKITQLYDSLTQVEEKYTQLKQNRMVELSEFIKSTEMMRICDAIDEYEARRESLDVSGVIDEEQRAIREQIRKLECKEEKVSRTFVRKCPYQDCVGMLSLESKTEKSNFICKLCSSISCSECREIVKDETTHECNKETLQTISFIEETSKPCPNCNSPIHKIHGCFAKNTIIPLANGMNKCVNEIKVGDQLIGDDHSVRNVLHTFEGLDYLYQVNQSNGESYIVNSKHNLILRNSHGRVYSIMAETFMEIDDDIKPQLFGYKIHPITNEISTSTISVSKYKYGKYYGFTLDGNNKFLFTDGTVLSNCHQMFCTKCHTAFDWKTLRISKGNIHNPHWFEWQRTIGQAGQTRNPLDIQCGQELTNTHVAQIMTGIRLLVIGNINKPNSGVQEVRNLSKDERIELHDTVNHLEQLMIRIIHHHVISIPRYQIVAQHRVNQQLRMNFLKKIIDENIFRIQIQRVDKAESKKQDILNILVTYRTAGTDISYRLLADINNGVLRSLHKLEEYIQEFLGLETYINNCLQAIRDQYQSKSSANILEV
jgi:hypothetical protein